MNPDRPAKRDRQTARGLCRARWLLALTLSVHAAGAFPADAYEDASVAINRFLQGGASQPHKASASHAGRVTLPPCLRHEVFLPPGATPWGRTTFGLRCHSPEAWTRFVQVDVAVEGRYFTATRTVEPGQPVGASDFSERLGDLTRLPRGVITEAAELDGVVASNRIIAGAPLRRDLVRPATVIRAGQLVRVVARGQGFAISLEAQALNSAAAGGSVQVKTPEGRLLKGVAQVDGKIELTQ